jgi:hypothetical protein
MLTFNPKGKVREINTVTENAASQAHQLGKYVLEKEESMW